LHVLKSEVRTFSHSLVSQFVFAFLPGREPLNYYLCAGYSHLADVKMLNSQAVKANWVLTLLICLSLFGPFVVKLRIKLSDRLASKFLPKVENDSCAFLQLHSISDFLSDIFNMFLLSFCVWVSIKINSINPSDIAIYPNNHIINFSNLLLPPCGFLMIQGMYYLRHQPLRTFLIREFKNYMGLEQNVVTCIH
jgi:uncharacterized membrane protein